MTPAVTVPLFVWTAALCSAPETAVHFHDYINKLMVKKGALRMSPEGIGSKLIEAFCLQAMLNNVHLSCAHQHPERSHTY